MNVSDEVITIGTVVLVVVVLALFLFMRRQAQQQEQWREEKLRSIDAKRAAIAARKRGQDPDNKPEKS